MHVVVTKDSTLVLLDKVSSWYTFTLNKKFLRAYETLKKSGLERKTERALGLERDIIESKWGCATLRFFG